jgi:hypothetical protein
MFRTRVIRLIVALVMVVCYSGSAGAQEVPTPQVPPPVDAPPVLPSPPEVQTFAVCGAGATCDCANVISVAQARDGQSCTVTSSTGTCTFQSRVDDVGVCCVCRP